ncbi:Hypothetical_protein [Hexamita inflata]|uniref:Hypothetical_protein n=1 Tax=Hexamita inflata TaxID=28002 RepID=A0AA86NJ79_9EUKA|nr:Hypothetical protein HINF_LOCUS7699 [Hexamita inflata]
MGIHLRRTICVSKETMELPLSNPKGSLMACPQPYRSLIMPAQLFEPGDFTFRNRFSRISGSGMRRNEKRDQMNPSSTRLNKAGISAMPLQFQRRTPILIVLTLHNIIINKFQQCLKYKYRYNTKRTQFSNIIFLNRTICKIQFHIQTSQYILTATRNASWHSRSLPHIAFQKQRSITNPLKTTTSRSRCSSERR